MINKCINSWEQNFVLFAFNKKFTLNKNQKNKFNPIQISFQLKITHTRPWASTLLPGLIRAWCTDNTPDLDLITNDKLKIKKTIFSNLKTFFRKLKIKHVRQSTRFKWGKSHKKRAWRLSSQQFSCLLRIKITLFKKIWILEKKHMFTSGFCTWNQGCSVILEANGVFNTKE